mgnify:CR=1 FL=1|jgi:hypothetical protein
MNNDNDSFLKIKADLDKNPDGTDVKIAHHRHIEKHGRYVAIPGDKNHTRIFVRDGEDQEKRIAAYLERINNRPQKWN